MEEPNDESCQELTLLKDIRKPVRRECEECVKSGSPWVHLRTCQTCGKTHCCDNSVNRHATRHFRETGHPVVISAEKGERWAWCYIHETFAEY